jgi:hypothetical protein
MAGSQRRPIDAEILDLNLIISMRVTLGGAPVRRPEIGACCDADPD